MSSRASFLPLAAIVASAGLIGVQVAAGGADFKPPALRDPCAAQPLPAPTDDLDRVAQTIVFDGAERAACALGVPPEELLLAIPDRADRQALLTKAGHTDDDLAVALRRGLLETVDRLERGGRLPTAAQVLPKYAAEAGLPALAVDALGSVPPDVVNGYFPVGDVLRDALQNVDLASLLRNLDGPGSLDTAVQRVITEAAVKQIRKVVGEQLPPQLKALLGLP